MANPKFCYPNWLLPTPTIVPTITGPGWIDLPKLQGDVLSEMARYPGVNPVNTKLVFDLGTTRAARVFAMPFHNAKPGDRGRIRFASDAGFTSIVLDTGFQDFFGESYPFGSLEWGRVEWLDGRLTVEQTAGKTLPWMFVSPTDVYGRYVEVSVDFSTNSDGYVDMGQVVVSGAITPIYNFSYGCSVPFYRDTSTKSRAKGGPQFADKARPYRVTKMQLDWLSQNEAYGPFYEMVRDYGVTKPFFYIHDASAPAAVLQKQSFMATAETISDLTHLRFGAYSLAIEISEAF